MTFSKRDIIPLFFLVSFCLVGGCTSDTVPVRGRVVKNGEAVTLAPGEKLKLAFYPHVEKGKPEDSFASQAYPDGTFEVPGKRGKGLPPGKYRIALQLPRSLELKDKSPIIREVTGQEIVIDVAHPNP